MDRLTLALVLFSAYPLAWLFQSRIGVAPTESSSPSSSVSNNQASIRNTRWRHGFSLVVSLPLMALGFPLSLVLQCLGMSLLVWSGTRMLQSVPIIRKYASWWPPAVFVGLLSFLALHHIQHQWWGVQPDLTVGQMINNSLTAGTLGGVIGVGMTSPVAILKAWPMPTPPTRKPS